MSEFLIEKANGHNKYNLKNEIDSNAIPQISGVYEIYYKDICLYVGQTKNFNQRLRNHLSFDTFLKAKKELEEEYNPKWMPAKINAFNRYQFFQTYKDELTVIYKFVALNKLNEEEKKTIEALKPIFNYAGVKKDFVPYKRNSEKILFDLSFSQYGGNKK